MPEVPQSLDRHLHYIVRHPGYDQYAAYGYFLDSVTDTLNRQMNPDSESLLHNMSWLMSERRSEKAKNRAIACLGLDEASAASIDWHGGLGPALRGEFGYLQDYLHDVDHAIKHVRGEYRIFAPAHTVGHGFVTVIPQPSKADDRLRAYWETLCVNQPEAETSYEKFHIHFEYPIPGKPGKMLTLMHIGDFDSMREQAHKTHYKGDPRVIDHEIDIKWASARLFGAEKKLYYLHAPCSPEYRKELCECLDPLLAVIDRKEKAAKGEPPIDKLEAVATYYWLMAQSTPPRLGGSAMANITLEHLSHRLREQGYDYMVPHKAMGVDLWAEATTTPLDQFVERFIQKDHYFDRNATDVEVGAYLASWADNYANLMQNSRTLYAMRVAADMQNERSSEL